MDKSNIKEYIRALDHIREFLNDLLESHDELENKNDKLLEFTNLRLLARSEVWPEAVPQDLICKDIEEEKLLRASEIISEFDLNVENQNFLDFGCGEGHVVLKMAENDKSKCVGYDVKDQNWSHFNKKDNFILSTDWSDIEKNGPYDLILCNDVLDHTKNPEEELKKIQKLKRPQTGKVIVRVHPWTSRHGSHLYKQLNKAYLHLVFDEDELFVMGIEPQEINKISNPTYFYKSIFKNIGFTVLREDIITQELEDFFILNEKINKRIQKNLGLNGEVNKILINKILEIQFLEFILI